MVGVLAAAVAQFVVGHGLSQLLFSASAIFVAILSFVGTNQQVLRRVAG